MLLLATLLAASCTRLGFGPGRSDLTREGDVTPVPERWLQPDGPGSDAPRPDAPRPDGWWPDAPKPGSDGLKPDKPGSDGLKPGSDAPKLDKPGSDAPKPDGPGSDAPKLADGGGIVPLWCKQIGGTGNDVGKSVVTDAAGNVYLAGTFEGSVDFGAGVTASAGGADVYITSYTAAGAYRWSRTFGSTLVDKVAGIGVDASGNVYMAGTLRGAANYGGGALLWSGSADLFVVSYTGAGAPRWGKAFGDNGYQDATGMSVDETGNVYVNGSYDGKLMLGSGVSVTAVEGYDVFASSLTSVGGPRWAASWNYGTAVWYDYGESITHDSLGNAYVTFTSNNSGLHYIASRDASGAARWIGNTSATVYGMACGVTTVYSVGGNSNAVVLSHDNTGATRWTKGFGKLGDLWRAVAVDAAENLHVVGHFSGTVDFGGGPMVSAGGKDWVVAKLSGATGGHLLSVRLGGPGEDMGLGIARDGTGNLYVSGSFDGSVDCGGKTLSSAGLTDALLVKLPP